MGTNYFMRARDSDFVRKYFGARAYDRQNFDSTDFAAPVEDKYVETDGPAADGTPLLEQIFDIHLHKQSFGWKPLIQWYPDAWKSFGEMEAFIQKHGDNVEIMDEYGAACSVKDYLDKIRTWQEHGGQSHVQLFAKGDGFIDPDGYEFWRRPFY